MQSGLMNKIAASVANESDAQGLKRICQWRRCFWRQRKTIALSNGRMIQDSITQNRTL